MSRAPSTVDQAAAYAARMAAKQAHATSRPTQAARRYRIKLRRFAGPVAYADQISHLRIAHLTDQHVGRVTPMEVQRAAVELANGEKPDLILLSGDFVCHSQLYLDQLTEVVRGFQAPAIAVLGNHDHWSGADEVRLALERGGVEVLRNRNTIITVRNERLQVVGLDDAYTGHARRDEAVKGLRPDLPAIGISHIAEEADGLWQHGIPLVLSGHTHGGQVTLARLHELAVGMIGGHKYVHGLYGTRESQPPTNGHDDKKGGRNHHGKPEPAGAVYVGAGIGAAVVPLRLGDRGKREVTIFELGCQPGDFVEHHSEQEALRGRKPTAKLIARRAAAVVRKRLDREIGSEIPRKR
ncbi:MAG TPA: metallophosphoesterase [Polyangia bacterium]|nr:metallophosphoesterase [Polyangia bacterium]